jgi:hypothetical protein
MVSQNLRIKTPRKAQILTGAAARLAPLAAWRGGERRSRLGENRPKFGCQAVREADDFRVIVGLERRACFLHALVGGFDRGFCRVGHFTREVRDVRIAQAIGCLNQQGVDFGNDALGVAAGAGACVAGHLDRILGALTAVDREAQGQPVIALRHRLFRAFERVSRGAQFGGCVLCGTSGFGSGDGALRLIHLFAGRLGACD